MNWPLFLTVWLFASALVGVVVGKMIKAGSMNDEDALCNYGEHTMDLKEQHQKECKKFEEAQQRFYRASAERSVAERELHHSKERLKRLEHMLRHANGKALDEDDEPEYLEIPGFLRRGTD